MNGPSPDKHFVVGLYFNFRTKLPVRVSANPALTARSTRVVALCFCRTSTRLADQDEEISNDDIKTVGNIMDI